MRTLKLQQNYRLLITLLLFRLIEMLKRLLSGTSLGELQ
jgi:hypothetical protein